MQKLYEAKNNKEKGREFLFQTDGLKQGGSKDRTFMQEEMGGGALKSNAVVYHNTKWKGKKSV